MLNDVEYQFVVDADETIDRVIDDFEFVGGHGIKFWVASILP